MTKMFGEMTGEEVMNLFHKVSKEVSEAEAAGNHRSAMLMIPKSTFVALVGEFKDCLNRKFFFELGRSLQLEENQDSVGKTVPQKYRADYEDGVHQRQVVQQLMDDKCKSCEKNTRFVSLNSVRGKVFIGREQEKEK